MKCRRVNLCLSMVVVVLVWGLAGCSLPVIDSKTLKASDIDKLKSDESQDNLTNKIIYFLPKGHIKLTYVTTPVEKMTAEIVYFPDPDRYYMITYHSIPWYKDDVKVTISKEGLLSAINVTTENQAGAIIGKALEISKSFIAPTTKAAPEKGIEVPPFKVEPFEVTVEPPDTGIPIDILTGQGKVGTISLVKLFGDGLSTLNSSTLNGVCFRPALPCRLTVHLLNGKECTLPIMLPNWSPVVSIDITRGLAQKIQEIKFTDGMLTEVHWKKEPSDLLALLSIPAETAKGLLGLPLDLFKVQVQSDKK